MPTIDTLASDIQNLFGQTLDGNSTELGLDTLTRFGVDVAQHVADDREQDREREALE